MSKGSGGTGVSSSSNSTSQNQEIDGVTRENIPHRGSGSLSYYAVEARSYRDNSEELSEKYTADELADILKEIKSDSAAELRDYRELVSDAADASGKIGFGKYGDSRYANASYDLREIEKKSYNTISVYSGAYSAAFKRENPNVEKKKVLDELTTYKEQFNTYYNERRIYDIEKAYNSYNRVTDRRIKEIGSQLSKNDISPIRRRKLEKQRQDLIVEKSMVGIQRAKALNLFKKDRNNYKFDSTQDVVEYLGSWGKIGKEVAKMYSEDINKKKK